MLIKHLVANGFDTLHLDRKGKIGDSIAVLFKTTARLDKFSVYTYFEHISVVLQTLIMWVCVVCRSFPPIDGISGGTFFDEIAELFEILVDKNKITITW